MLAGSGSPRDHDAVESAVVRLAHPRRGHFDLGTGYHGSLWLDLDALFLRPSLLRPHVCFLSERLRDHQVDAVCGPMEGGAFLAFAVADLLDTAFLPAYRCPATLPGSSAPPGSSTAYRLPAVPGGISGWRLAIVGHAGNRGTAGKACLGHLHDH